MRKIYLSIIITCLFLNFNKLIAQTIWTGPITTFERVNELGLDLSLEVNQDRITDIVWITRASTKGIFNIYSENVYADSTSPTDTEWAFGTTANIGITFSDWETTVAPTPPDMVGRDMVLHLITDDIYIDIKFISWETGKTGGHGGFSYERSTDQLLSTNEYELNNEFKIYPNPSKDFIQISGITNTLNFKVHNVLGAEILNGNIEKEGEINIQNLSKGIYVIHFENGTALKFVKN